MGSKWSVKLIKERNNPEIGFIISQRGQNYSMYRSYNIYILLTVGVWWEFSKKILFDNPQEVYSKSRSDEWLNTSLQELMLMLRLPRVDIIFITLAGINNQHKNETKN